MPNLIYGLIAGGIALSPIAVQNSVLAKASGQRLDANLPICYLRTARQKVVNLSRLCNVPQIKSKPQMTVLNFEKQGDRLIGQVRNDTGKTVRYAIVKYTITPEGSPSSSVSRFVYVTPESLKPGQVGMFEGTLNELGNVAVGTVEWEGEQKQARN
ncbi:hypothetical protein ACKFKF_26690 [Phormidesmis sp. 146-12]